MSTISRTGEDRKTEIYYISRIIKTRGPNQKTYSLKEINNNMGCWTTTKIIDILGLINIRDRIYINILENCRHKEVEHFDKQNLPVILIGHRNHPEVIGTMGQTNNELFLVEKVEDVTQAYNTAFNNSKCLKMILDWREVTGG